MDSRFYIEMMGKKIEAELLLKDAPKTCQAMLECMPLDCRAIHAKFAGLEIIIMVPFMTEPENEILDVQPGDIGYYPGRQTICIFYGDTKPFGKVNVFARVKNSLEDLNACGKVILQRGVIKAKLASSNK